MKVPLNSWLLQTDTGLGLAARFLVLATGMLHRPAIPALRGIESFRGVTFHSACWRHGTEIKGKHVAVIGTGASAAQCVPYIAKHAARLVLFQRTPPWVLPRSDPAFSSRQRWALRHVPLLRRSLRAWLYWTHETRAFGFVLFPSLMAAPERRARSHAKRQVSDDALRHLLTPADRMGCKRVLLSNDFFPSLTRPNVRLMTVPIAGVVPDGLVTEDGIEHRADVLIFATGFRATDPFGSIKVVGRNGVTLSEAWCNGMQARLGMAMAGFPSLFLLGGPNTGLGHNSVVFMLEAQIGHVLRCLRLVTQRNATSIEVRQPTGSAGCIHSATGQVDAAHDLVVGMPKLVFGPQRPQHNSLAWVQHRLLVAHTTGVRTTLPIRRHRTKVMSQTSRMGSIRPLDCCIGLVRLEPRPAAR